MKKIAICLPSFNEANNIHNITNLVDRALCQFDNKYECMIVNADNNSSDGTNNIFRNISTTHQKISLVTNKIGKGENILNFLKYCKSNEIFYGITIDSDLKSFSSVWLTKMVTSLERGYAFVCPLYKRSRFEGNTTNHFVVPFIYSLFGKSIRQPIGGDYAFNQEFINMILDKRISSNIKKYGIDIYLLINAIQSDMKIEQVELGFKKHSPSYMRMEEIFESVAKGAVETISFNDIYGKKNIISDFDYIGISEFKDEKMINNIKEKYYSSLKRLNLKNTDYDLIREMWSKELQRIIKNIKNGEAIISEYIKDLFICRSVSYWIKFKDCTVQECEDEIWNFSKMVSLEVENGNNN